MADKKKPGTTLNGIMEAVQSGDATVDDLIGFAEANPKLFGIEIKPEADPKAVAALKQYGGQAREEEKTRCPVPGRKPRPKARRRGAPARQPAPGYESEKPAEVLSGFESLMGEACPWRTKRKKKTKKESLEESLHEFAAPERQDVIRWARGDAPQRKRDVMPFYFEGDTMFSRKKQIAQRNAESKTARVLSPKVLDAISGRHAVLCEKGLRYAGYDVEIVEEL